MNNLSKRLVADDDDVALDVEPQLVVRSSEHWFLVAWCQERQALRWFRADRIQGLMGLTANQLTTLEATPALREQYLRLAFDLPGCSPGDKARSTAAGGDEFVPNAFIRIGRELGVLKA